MKEKSSMENSIEEDIKILEEFKTNGYNVLLMKYGDRIKTNFKLAKAIEHILKELKRFENMYEAEHQIHLVRNEQLDRKQKAIIKCNELENENKELEKENEELKHKVEGQECVIETQAHNEEVYEKLVIKLEKENEELKILKDDIKDKRIVYVDTPEFEENYISVQKIKDIIDRIDYDIKKTNEIIENGGISSYQVFILSKINTKSSNIKERLQKLLGSEE